MNRRVITTAIDREPPRIEFPCAYPIKVLGLTGESFLADVVAVIARHSFPVRDEQLSVRESAKGNYISVTVIIEATGEDQLQNIFADLKKTASVKLVL